MDRFTRFKILRALWARAKNLMAWIVGPKDRDERLRAQRWQQINSAERYIRDGFVRGTGDPDSYLRPPVSPVSQHGADPGSPGSASLERAYQEYARALRGSLADGQRTAQQAAQPHRPGRG